MNAFNRVSRWVVVAASISAMATLVAQAPAPAPRQEVPATKGIVPKGKAPVSNTVLQVTLPRPQQADLANGLHVLVLEDRRAPQVTFQLIVRGAGGYYDPADHIGLAQFTAAMLREGTTSRSSQQISEELDRLAATVNVSSGLSAEDATVSGSALTEHLDRVLDLAADIVLNPTFPEQELARYKAQTRAQLVQQRSQPAFLGMERYSRALGGDHPSGRVAPTIETLDRTTRDQLAASHKAHYAPDGGVIAFAGDISLAEAMKKLETRFGTWKKSGTAAPRVGDPPALSKPGVFLVSRPNSVQTNLLVGTQTITRLDPDYYALTVLNKVIGGGPTGRLFRHLREDKGYTYGAYSNLSAPRYRGTWTANTEVRTEVTEAALTDLLEELRQLREVPIAEEEFAAAKRSLVASFALELESPNALLGNALVVWRYGLPADYWDQYPKRIAAITQADVQAVAKKYLDPSRIQIVAVGNSDAIGPALRKLGGLELYDTEGNRIPQ